MGIFIALFIIISWLSHSAYMLIMLEWNPLSIWMWLHVALQTYLSVGLFITAHDAMHGTVSLNRRINNSLGWIACFLFAGMNYKRLITNHMAHHTFPGTEKDPDYDISQNYVIWFLRFMIRYTTISQLIVMGALFNLLKFIAPEINIWIFWVIPSLLGALQLFTFGTYIPHRTPHTHEMEPHNARTLKKNHLYAMLTCYFFGYHHEHHSSPRTPWWKLYSMK